MASIVSEDTLLRIGGDFLEPVSGQTPDVFDPSNREVLANIAPHRDDETQDGAR